LDKKREKTICVGPITLLSAHLHHHSPRGPTNVSAAPLDCHTGVWGPLTRGASSTDLLSAPQLHARQRSIGGWRPLGGPRTADTRARDLDWWAQLVIVTRLLSFLCHVGPSTVPLLHRCWDCSAPNAAESARWPNPRLCLAFPLTIKPAEHLGPPPLHPPVSCHSIPPSPCGRQELFPHQLRTVAAGSHRGRGIDLKDPFRGKGGPQGKARWHLRALGSPVAALFAHRSRWLPRCHLGLWAG
jgi:hypothetical protein